MKFIDWCNCNQGFLSFILACLSFLLSAIAIVYSIINFTSDNKKKFNVNGSIIIDGSKKNNLIISVANTGNKPIGIERVSIVYDNCYLSCKCNTTFWPKTLMPAESFTLKYDLDTKYIEKCIKSNADKQLNKHFKICVIDTIGNEHKCKNIYLAI